MKLTTAGIAAARSALASRPWSPRAQMFPPCCRGPLEEREGWSLARLLLARIQRGGCTESGNILPVFLWVNVTRGVVAHFTVSISLSNVWLCGGEKGDGRDGEPASTLEPHGHTHQWKHLLLQCVCVRPLGRNKVTGL